MEVVEAKHEGEQLPDPAFVSVGFLVTCLEEAPFNREYLVLR